MNAPEDLTRVPHTDPLEIYRYRDGLYAVDLLTAAVCEFDFFTWLEANPGDADSIGRGLGLAARPDRKSTRLNSSHLGISYAVFCLK